MGSRDPRVIPRTTRSDGLVVAWQPPPPSSRSFSATYIAPAGFAFDPDGAPGLARLVAETLPSATAAKDRVVLSKELDRLGATLRTSIDPESIDVSIWGPAAESARLMRLLSEAISTPRFDPTDLERVRRQILEQQLRELTQPDRRAERALLETIFPKGHPYRETGLGTRGSIARARPADLRKFHARTFSSSGGSFVVTGFSSLETTVAAVRAALPSLPASAAPPTPAIPPLRPVRETPIEIELPGRSQVEVRVGGRGIARASDRFDGAFLANEVLGGRQMLGRLFQRARESEGLAYHSGSELEALRWGGHWTAFAGTGPERTTKLVPILLEEVDRIRTDRIPAHELDTIRESAIGEIPLGFETTARAHQLALDVTDHALPPDFLVGWPDRLRALTPAKVRDAAELAFDRSSQTVVLAGPIPKS